MISYSIFLYSLDHLQGKQELADAAPTVVNGTSSTLVLLKFTAEITVGESRIDAILAV